MLLSWIPWNMPRVTCIFRIHTSLYNVGECVYEENTSDKWHVPRYPMRKHCIKFYFIPCLNHRKTYGNFGKSSEISMNFQKFQKRFKPIFEELFLKTIEETFGKLQKQFKSVFQLFLWLFKISGKSLEIFGSVRKSLEIFGKLRKRFKSNF